MPSFSISYYIFMVHRELLLSSCICGIFTHLKRFLRVHINVRVFIDWSGNKCLFQLAKRLIDCYATGLPNQTNIMKVTVQKIEYSFFKQWTWIGQECIDTWWWMLRRQHSAQWCLLQRNLDFKSPKSIFKTY